MVAIQSGLTLRLRSSLAMLAIGLLALVIAPAASAAEFGAAWSEVGTDALPVAIGFHTSLTFDDQIWVIGGSIGGVIQEKVYSSSDGETWAEVGTDALPAARAQHCSVVFDHKMWVIGGQDGTSTQDNVYSSSDGATWVEVGTDALPTNLSQANCMVASDKIYVIGGSNAGTDSVETVYSSPDGATWTEEGTNALPVGVRGGEALFFNGAFYLIAGNDDGALLDTVYRSPDAITWTQVGTLPEVRYTHRAIAAGGQIWVIGGFDSTLTAQETVFSSVDGETWVTVGDDPLDAAINNHSLAFFNGKIWATGDGQKVFSTDDIIGAEQLQGPEEQITGFSNEISQLDQSGDTATSDLPILKIAAAEEAATGWPLVEFTVTIAILCLALILGFLMSRLAPDHKVLTGLVILAVVAVGFVVGREAIPWYVFLAAAGVIFGLVSLGSRIQG